MANTHRQDSRATNSDAQSASESVNASTNSDAASKDTAGDMAAPYGTRSRNRTGNARINYAEDKDIDADVYDYYHDNKDPDGSKKPSRQANAAANGDGPRGGVAARRAAASDEAKPASSQNFGKDTTSSVASGLQGAQQTSTSSGGALASRKRKAAAAGTVSTRRTGQSVQASGTTWPDTNVLTFDDCKSRPDANGRMVADDGTVLEPNGKLGCCTSGAAGVPLIWGHLGRTRQFQQHAG